MNCNNLVIFTFVFCFTFLKINCEKVMNPESGDDTDFLAKQKMFEVLKGLKDKSPGPITYQINVTLDPSKDEEYLDDFFYQKVNMIEPYKNNKDDIIRLNKVDDRTFTFFGFEFQNKYSITYNLNACLIIAAVWAEKIDRLTRFLTQKRHIHLSDDDKVKVFDLAIKNLKKPKSSENENARYEILSLLLYYNFDKGLKDAYMRGLIKYENMYKCELYPVFEDPHAAKIFLNHDINYFENNSECEFMQRAVENNDFETAIRAFNNGLNSKIKYFCLMKAMAATKCSEILINSDSSDSEKKICTESEIKRQEFIDGFMKIPGNHAAYEIFWAACSANNSEIAQKILDSHVLELNNEYNHENSYASPLKAVLESNDCNLIQETLKLFLKRLSLNQLKSVQFSCKLDQPFRPYNSDLKKAAVEKVLKEVERRIYFLDIHKYLENWGDWGDWGDWAIDF